ncbi:MucR family transcriptional regulator [Desulfovibrio psychrotolerans]|nr:MucR family transcriptional regulator [Desulfovibrio psychrotolerans]
MYIFHVCVYLGIETNPPLRGAIMNTNPYFDQAMAMVQAQAGVKQMTPAEMIAMVKDLAEGLAKLSGSEVAECVCEEAAEGPVVDPKKAIKQNSIICVECGKSFKILGKKHLATHGLTPNEYREKHGYKKGTALVCKSLAKQRKEKMASMRIWEKVESRGKKSTAKPAKAEK